MLPTFFFSFLSNTCLSVKTFFLFFLHRQKYLLMSNVIYFSGKYCSLRSTKYFSLSVFLSIDPIAGLLNEFFFFFKLIRRKNNILLWFLFY